MANCEAFMGVKKLSANLSFLMCVDFIINKKEIIPIVKINKQNYGRNTFPIKKIPNPITDHTISQKFIPNS